MTNTNLPNKNKMLGAIVPLLLCLTIVGGCSDLDKSSTTQPTENKAPVSLDTKNKEIINLAETSCDLLEKMEKSEDFSSRAFGYYELVRNKDLIQSAGLALAKLELGEDYKEVENGGETVYSKGSKEVKTYTKKDVGPTLSYRDADKTPSGRQELGVDELLGKVRKLMVETLKVGNANQFYIPEIMDGSPSYALMGGGNGGNNAENFKMRRFPILRIIDGMSTLGGSLDVALAVYGSDGTLFEFHLSGLTLGTKFGVIRGAELIKVNEAKQMVLDKLRAEYKDPQDYQIKCQVGYLDNGKNGIGIMVAPYYLFRVIPNNQSGTNGDPHEEKGETIGFPATEKEAVVTAFKNKRF